MHCPQCDQQISPLRALFGWGYRPFDCSRCGIELELAPGLIRLLYIPALAILWRVRAEYGDSAMTLSAFAILVLLLAISQLLLMPVRRFVAR